MLKETPVKNHGCSATKLNYDEWNNPEYSGVKSGSTEYPMKYAAAVMLYVYL